MNVDIQIVMNSLFTTKTLAVLGFKDWRFESNTIEVNISAYYNFGCLEVLSSVQEYITRKGVYNTMQSIYRISVGAHAVVVKAWNNY